MDVQWFEYEVSPQDHVLKDWFPVDGAVFRGSGNSGDGA
jgi:hypothetical protein